LTVSRRRRREKPSSKVDEIIQDYTKTNAGLERENASLKESIGTILKDHDRQIKAQKDTTIALQRDLDISREHEAKALRERDLLRERMATLNQSYLELETEYRRRAPLATPDDDDDDDEQSTQAKGEESQQAPQHIAALLELNTLRAENDRLHHDVELADDRLRMAVQRIEALIVENSDLKQQVAMLQGQVQPLTHENQVLQQTLARLRQDICRTSAAERLQKNSLSSWDHPGADGNEQQVVQPWDEIGIEERAMRGRKRTEESAKPGSRSVISEPKSTGMVDIATTQNTIPLLNAQSNAMKKDRLMARQLESDEISVRDARILELETRLHEASNVYTLEDVQTRDKEIAQLRDLHQASQSLMEKAVERQNLLLGEVSALTKDNSALDSQVKELNNQLARFLQKEDDVFKIQEEHQLEMDQIKRELESREAMALERQNEVETVRAELLRRDDQIQKLQLALSSACDLRNKGEELKSVQSSKESTNDELELESRVLMSDSQPNDTVDIVASQNAIASLNAQLNAMKKDLLMARQLESDEISRRDARIRELETRLQEGGNLYTLEDVQTREKEIAQLRNLNQASQIS